VSERDYNLYISDILQSIKNISEYTAGMDETKFKSDKKTIDAVIRNFEIIGEAANKLPDEIRMKTPKIPWRDIIDFRNRIAHEYFGLSVSMVWQIIEKELDPLRNNIEKLKIS
jgi:uncharacterized protein with HEPN domain